MVLTWQISLGLDDAIREAAERAVESDSEDHEALIELTGQEIKYVSAALRAFVRLGAQVVQRRVEDRMRGELPEGGLAGERIASDLVARAAAEVVHHNVPDPRTGIVPLDDVPGQAADSSAGGGCTEHDVGGSLGP